MISVVVVTYNSREVVGRCLESTRSLAEAGSEVVVVDNASSDDTVEFIRSAFPFCRVLAEKSNAGFGCANNRGADMTSGHLMLLNPDAWLSPGCAEGLAGDLDRDPKLGQVSPQIRDSDGTPQFVWSPTTSIVGEGLQKLRALGPRALMHRPVGVLLRCFDAGWVTAGCTMIRREAWEEIGGFDEDYFLYFEDVDLSLRLRQAGWKVAADFSLDAFHLVGSSGIAEEHYRRSQFLYYRKHRPMWENRYLLDRQRRRFGTYDDIDLQRRMMAIVDEAEDILD